MTEKLLTGIQTSSLITRLIALCLSQCITPHRPFTVPKQKQKDRASCCFSGIKVGEKLTEGKTKCIYEIPDTAGHVLIQSKDRITAGDGDRAHDMKGKAAISNATNAAIFELLINAGTCT